MRLNPLAVALFASFASAGCLRLTEPVRPSAHATNLAVRAIAAENAQTATHGFFPLAIGNRWRYSFTSAAIGPSVPGGRQVWLQGVLTIELVGLFRIASREYTLARRTSTTTLTGSGFVYTLIDSVGYREDAQGLHVLYRLPPDSDGSAESGVETAVRLASRPGPELWEGTQLSGLIESESQLLSYPLHPGATWTIADPIQAIVEGIDVLDLSIGRLPSYRVRTYAQGVADIQIVSWWSRRGLLREYRLARQRCLDPICPPPDTFDEDILTVEEVHLEGSPPGK